MYDEQSDLLQALMETEFTEWSRFLLYHKQIYVLHPAFMNELTVQSVIL